jgi:hypothetical protein
VDAGQQCPGGQGAAGPEAEEQEGGRHQEVDLPGCQPTRHVGRCIQRSSFVPCQPEQQQTPKDLILQASQHGEHKAEQTAPKHQRTRYRRRRGGRTRR